ncbi:hypothetical protein Leryth_024878 [Lithospermum erythrorhizon]|nr:hypothetical protein Leryth_024878 [Lithospermum erythrorhizon]
MKKGLIVNNIQNREVGGVSSINFAQRVAASQEFVVRFDISRKLVSHRGCVNTLDFNSVGNILASASDDTFVILWDWETGRKLVSCLSGHHNNVFQAKFMPFSNDSSLVTCAADGQVRLIEIAQNGMVGSQFLCKHRGGAHKLAIEPGSPHNFYTCGEDGVVQHIDLRTRTVTKLFTCLSKRNVMCAIHLHAIVLDPRNPNLFAVAGTDAFARLYDIRKFQWDATKKFAQPVEMFCPLHLMGDVDAGITGLAFSEQSELLVSYNDEFIYLFAREMGLGPNPILASNGSDTVESSSNSMADFSHVVPTIFKGHRNFETIKGVYFFGPKCEYVMSGSDCGRIFIWKKKDGELIRVMEADKHVVNCIEPHPHIPVLASSGIENDIKIWVPKAIERSILPTNIDITARHHLFPFGFGDLRFDNDNGIYIFTDDDDGDDDGDNNDADEDDDSDYGEGSSDYDMDEYDSFDSSSEEEHDVSGDTFGDLDNDDEIDEELHEHADNPYLDDDRARYADYL